MDSKKTVYPYIPNSAPDVQAEMMAEVGISDVMELYEEIPEAIRYQGALNLPEAFRMNRESNAISNASCQKTRTAMNSPTSWEPAAPSTMSRRSAMKLHPGESF